MGVIEGTHTAIPDRGTERRRWLAAGHEPSPRADGRSRSAGDEHHVADGNDRPTRL